MVTLPSILIPTVLLIALVALPLAWRIRADRRRHRAEVLRGDILSAVNRRLGGESLITVEVIPEGLGRSGRIVLWAPEGFTDVAATVWRDVLDRTPAGYELVITTRRERKPESLRPLRDAAAGSRKMSGARAEFVLDSCRVDSGEPRHARPPRRGTSAA
jgi:hypothetical protein